MCLCHCPCQKPGIPQPLFSPSQGQECCGRCREEHSDLHGPGDGTVGTEPFSRALQCHCPGQRGGAGLWCQECWVPDKRNAGKKMYLQHGHLRVAALHRPWSATTDITVLEKEMGTNGAPQPSQESLAPSALPLREWQYQTEGFCMKLQAKSSQLHQQTLKHPLLGNLGSVCKIRRLSLFI